MATIKLNLAPGTSYTGPKGKGQLQKDVEALVQKLFSGKIDIPGESTVQETITFRLEETQLKELKKLAAQKNISLQKLLRLGMEEAKLITHI